MRYFSTIKSSFVVLLLASSLFGEQIINPNHLAIDILNKMRSHSKTPGLQYLIINSDSTIFEYNGGFSDLRNKTRFLHSTTLNAYSVTKTFTALAILQLHEAGKLNINDDAKLYLGYLPYSSNFTICELLNHTSGLPNPNPLRWVHLFGENEEFDFKEFKRMIVNKHDELDNQPGEKYSYSNIGYLLLGEIIETSSGQDYQSYIREHIFNKLHFQENAYLGFVIPDTTNHARGYIRKWSFLNLALKFIFDKDKFMLGTFYGWSQFRFLYVNGDSYGGLIGNARGFASYLQALLKPDVIISETSRKRLFKNKKTESGKTTKMCSGWFTGKLGDNTYYSHPGGGGGYYCEIRIYPGVNIASVIMFNRTGIKNEKILDKIDYVFLGR